MDGLAISRYTFHLPLAESSLLYNVNSGALLRFDGEDGLLLGQWLSGNQDKGYEDADLLGAIPASLHQLLVSGGFLLSAGTDELQTVRNRFWQARQDTPLVLTITTTQDCNLGCYYCYEERSSDKLGEGDMQGLLEFVQDQLAKSNSKSLHIDWYGGEPLLNVAFLERASLALQEQCQALGVNYHASVISNGTNWPEDAAAFARRHALRQVQISFDGMRERHNRSRRYRKGYGTGEDSSFDQAVQTVESLLDAARVDVRLNIGWQNIDDVQPFLEMASARGWFQRRYPAVIQPARLSAFTEQCGFLRPKELSQEQFEAIRQTIRQAVGDLTTIEETEAPDGLPLPKTSVCAALAQHSAVLGADGLEYRCGLQVGDPKRATGRFGGNPETAVTNANPFPILGQPQFPDRLWWDAFDPTTLPTCSVCSFLPICLGGCPHKHLTEDRHALDEQGAYWRANLARLMAERAGLTLPDKFFFTQADQFRPQTQPAN